MAAGCASDFLCDKVAASIRQYRLGDAEGYRILLILGSKLATTAVWPRVFSFGSDESTPQDVQAAAK